MSKKKETNADRMSKFIKDMSGRAEIKKARSFPKVTTGMPSLDYLLKGGFAQGAVTEIFGPPNTGKSTSGVIGLVECFWDAIAQEQYIAYLDLEGRSDVRYWVQLGAPFIEVSDGEWECMYKDDNGVPYIQIIKAKDGVGEKYMQVILDMIKSGLYYMIIIDSIGNIAPKAELDSTIDGNNIAMGLVARLAAKWNRMVTPVLRDSGTIIIALNQAREIIDTTEQRFTATKKKSPGGLAFHHMGTFRLETYHMQDDWYDGKKREDLARIVIRFYLRKTSASDSIKALTSVNIVRDHDTGFYRVDKAIDLYPIAKTLGVVTNKKGEPYGSGHCYFDALNWGYIVDEFAESPYAYADDDAGDHRFFLGGSEADIVDAIRNDPYLYMALEDATRKKYGAQPINQEILQEAFSATVSEEKEEVNEDGDEI